MFFVKTQRTPTQTDTTILSVYSLSLVIKITGHSILTKNSKSERFVHFFARERQSDSPWRKRQLCVVKFKRKDLLSTSIVGKITILSLNGHFSIFDFEVCHPCTWATRVTPQWHWLNIG
jgi:hypothetical protein